MDVARSCKFIFYCSAAKYSAYIFYCNTQHGYAKINGVPNPLNFKREQLIIPPCDFLELITSLEKFQGVCQDMSNTCQ